MIYKDNERWNSEINGNVNVLKNYNSAKNKPLIFRNQELVLMQAPPTPLHDLHLGPVNHILENIGKDVKNFLVKSNRELPGENI